MSVERFFNDVRKTTTEAGYGYSCKAMAELIMECDPSIFTVAQVDSDTASKYSAWLQVYDTNMYLNVYNSSRTLYFAWCYGIKGTQILSVSQSDGCAYDANVIHRATVSRLGDFMFTVSVCSDARGMGCCASFAQGFSDSTNKDYYVVCSSTTSIGLLGYELRAPLDYIDYLIDASTGVRASGMDMTLNYASSNSNQAFAASGAEAILMPIRFCMYETTNKTWLGHMRWGGKYDIYQMGTNTAYDYKAQPPADYVLDGVTYKGVFGKLFIPVECE